VSRLPANLARRVDRLARRAHAFHRWAHHPLCAAYAPELLRVGRRGRLCRGCAATAAGAIAGLLLGAAAPVASGGAALALAGLYAAAAPLAILFPAATRPLPKALTRALPMAACGGAVATGLRAGGVGGLFAAAVAAALFAAAVALYRRRGPDREPCRLCPEAASPQPCSGARPIVRRERAFRRLAHRWIDRSGRPGSPPEMGHPTGAARH